MVDAERSPTLEFHKVEGLGNDFVLLDLRARATSTPLDTSLTRLRSLAPALCHRRTGVGADGLLVVTTSARGRARMIVVNHDGSRPEMCGNGLRCVATYLALAGGPRVFTVETDAGLLPCEVCALDDAARSGQVRVRMGPARRLGTRAPASAPSHLFHGISMGNPHAIAFVGDDEDPEQLARALGPGVERDPLFPDRTNVEFARRETADNSLTLWVWERGCGITEACGTGACATAAAAVDQGLAAADQEIEVRLPGGVLAIRVPSDRNADVEMRGPAREVFRGELDVVSYEL